MGDAGPGWARDDAPAPNLVLLVAEEADAVAVEHDEDLLLGRVAVRRSVQQPRLDDVDVEARELGPGRGAQTT